MLTWCDPQEKGALDRTVEAYLTTLKEHYDSDFDVRHAPGVVGVGRLALPVRVEAAMSLGWMDCPGLSSLYNCGCVAPVVVPCL